MKKFFYNGEINNQVKITDDEFNHITKVLRLPQGSEITLFNGDGFFYNCKIIEINKKFLVAELLNKVECKNVTNNKITLFQGIVKKPDNQTLIVQKMTELGAKKVVFFESDYTNAKVESLKLDRLEKIVIESSKQCGRCELLKVEKVNSFSKMIEKLNQYDLVIFAYENERQKSLNEIVNICENKNIAVIIGSEGGFSQEEVEKLENINAKVVCLGKTILRAETAAVACVSAVMCLAGEWQ